MKLTDKYGFITDHAVRKAYDRIISQPGFSGERSAEAFLRLVERYAARGIRLIPACQCKQCAAPAPRYRACPGFPKLPE